MENTPKTKWYQTSWATILFLIFFFPVGLFLMWKYAKWPKVAKWVVTGVFALFVIAGAFGDSPETASNTKTAETQQAQAATVSTQPQAVNNDTTSPTYVPVKTAATSAPVKTSETTSQKNAVRKAQSYLNYTGFSHGGLVAQLEYEQFSNADAIYGADNSGANWNEQAAKKAKSYVDYSAFSRGSLIDQLKYEKFTQEQAEFGANAVGL